MKGLDFLISVIVPAYNIKDYLPRCLDSIAAQTHKNLEIIVISDGSSDGTDDVIKDYASKDSRIVPIFKTNSGVSDTRNAGLEIAKGDYIGFVDGDDCIEPDMYEHLLSNALKYNADISHCGYQMVFPSRVDYYYNTEKLVVQDNNKGLRDIIAGDYVEPGLCNKLYKKECIKNLRMPANIKINEDVLFNFYAFKNSKLSVYEDIPFYHYILRKNSAATSKVNMSKLYDPIKVRKEIFEYSVEHCGFDIQSLAYGSYLYSVISLHRQINEDKSAVTDNTYKSYKKELKAVSGKFNLSKRAKIERFLFFRFEGLLLFTYKIYDKFISKNTDKYEVK